MVEVAAVVVEVAAVAVAVEVVVVEVAIAGEVLQGPIQASAAVAVASIAAIPARAVAGATRWEAGLPVPRWIVPVPAAGTSVDRTPAAEISIGRVRAPGT
ncbi:hypothetical protein [Synechococcus sp. Tobar12-5m-g]|uniref:hypothetical protein n=1 Tax=Synechococcus sp. Tobar12-5m-g TaxID=2823742 RepID=UPI0020CCCA9B|nr:hypothetical protein [Synechococcus sp. Tobar12-5m-g]